MRVEESIGEAFPKNKSELKRNGKSFLKCKGKQESLSLLLFKKSEEVKCYYLKCEQSDVMEMKIGKNEYKLDRET